MCKEIINNVPPALWGFIGAFIIAMASYRGVHHFTKKREASTRFNAASINFRNALDASIYQIERGVNEVAVIEANFVAHIEAIREFSLYLRCWQRYRFNKTRDEYQKWHDAVCNRGTTSKLFPERDTEYLAMQEISGKTLIDKLLTFAKLKG